MNPLTDLKISAILTIILILRYYHLEYKQSKDYTDKRQDHVNSICWIITLQIGYIMYQVGNLT